MTSTLKDTRRKLEADIETLRDREWGYVRAGLPRFGAMFGRDSCVVSWQLIDYDSSIARGTIELLAKTQGTETYNLREEEPGKIAHEWHPKPEEDKHRPWPLPYYGSVDSTSLFIYLCGLYYEKTVDSAWLTRLWPNIRSALDWCEKYGDLDGDLFIEYERKNPAGLFHQGWKDSRMDHLGMKPPIEIVEVQGYYYAALREAAEFALMLKDVEYSRYLLDRAGKLKENFLSEFWDPRSNGFALALSESKYPDMRAASNIGHLLFTGILDGEDKKVESIVNRLFRDDMLTPYGIRTHASSNPDFNVMSYHLGSIWPHDNWIIAQGLKRYDYHKEYNMIKSALYDVFQSLGEIPELFAVEDGQIKKISIACAPQAWASGALLNFFLE